MRLNNNFDDNNLITSHSSLKSNKLRREPVENLVIQKKEDKVRKILENFFLFLCPKKTAKRTEIKGHGRKNKEEFIGGTKKKKKKKRDYPSSPTIRQNSICFL